MNTWPKRVLFFDGDCALCNKTVLEVAKWDQAGEICFAKLSGEWGERAELEGLIDRSIDSIFYLKNGVEGLSRTAAVRAICADIGGFWHVFRLLGLLPKSVQNYLYDFVAERRLNWWGKSDGCLLELPEWRSRLLDK